jgi:hypothetical protein
LIVLVLHRLRQSLAATTSLRAFGT